MAARPDVPLDMVRVIREIVSVLPECQESDAWVGLQWRVRKKVVAHVFGGEDQLIRVIFRAEPDEVMALQHLGEPYFKAGYGRDVVGLVLDDDTDWTELGELLTDAYCLVAPEDLVSRVERPGS